MKERQQVAWISGRTPQQFIDNVNLATSLGYSLFSTHQVPDMFMGAILYKYVEEEIAGAFKESATVLKLVKDGDADNDLPASGQGDMQDQGAPVD